MTPWEQSRRNDVRAKWIVNVLAFAFVLLLGWLLHVSGTQSCPKGTSTIEGWQGGRYTHLCVTGAQPFDGIEQLEVKP